MRKPAFIVKIAADSIAKLRRVDVFRVLENCSREEAGPTQEYIKTNRPDLAGEVDTCMAEVNAFERGGGQINISTAAELLGTTEDEVEACLRLVDADKKRR